MNDKPQFRTREAVSRFFPSYDRQSADRLISWLETCGYEIVPRCEATLVPPADANGGIPHARSPEWEHRS